MDRRDFENQHGAQVPTESTAIRRIETYDSALGAARKLYGIFVRSCCLCGYHLDDFTISRNGFVFTKSELTKGEN